MGRYASIIVDDNTIEIKFGGLIAVMANDIGIETWHDGVILSYDDIQTMIKRLNNYYVMPVDPFDTYKMGMLMVWCGSHESGDKLVFV